jgi:hypothetical protein
MPGGIPDIKVGRRWGGADGGTKKICQMRQ